MIGNRIRPVYGGLFGASLLLGVISVCRADDDVEFFESKIRPVFIEHCYECHSQREGTAEGGLQLDSSAGVKKGGDSGAIVVADEPKASLLISALRYEELEMPPDQKLPAEVVHDFERWVRNGAVDPRAGEPVASEPAENRSFDYSAAQTLWSLQPLEPLDIPAGALVGWGQGRIDGFVGARLAARGLHPSPRASAATLLRRLSLDLVGLPPEAKWVDLGQEINDPLVLSRYIDELLASEQFGEHWARLWLDLMRYADDQAHIVGNNSSLFFPNAYLYRDWVIDSLNNDMPYDEFVRLQLAADVVTPEDPDDDVALGFVGLGPKYYRRKSPEVQADEWEDRVDVLSRGLLGLTVACARCHDHKYDPVSTADYYALAGVFASVEMFNRPLDDSREKDASGNAKKPEDAMHIIRDSQPRDLAVMIRGNVNRTGEVVPRGFLAAIGAAHHQDNLPPRRVEFAQGSGRYELAEQIVSPNNPLTARVFVNRVWAQLIGQPLVGTPSNFGRLGETPSHPELLDDLALRFMENSWSLKWLCREIVNSATYQQTSLGEPAEDDPENRWLSRMNRKPMKIEQWRDSLLMLAGDLDPQSNTEHLDPSSLDSHRRTIFCDVSRLKLNPMLALFDFPDPNVHSDQRDQSITASQKLFLMNSPFMIQTAERIASKIDTGCESHPAGSKEAVDERVALAYRHLFARSPSQQERDAAFAYLREGSWKQYIHALLLTNEIYLID